MGFLCSSARVFTRFLRDRGHAVHQCLKLNVGCRVWDFAKLTSRIVWLMCDSTIYAWCPSRRKIGRSLLSASPNSVIACTDASSSAQITQCPSTHSVPVGSEHPLSVGNNPRGSPTSALHIGYSIDRPGFSGGKTRGRRAIAKPKLLSFKKPKSVLQMG